MTINELLAAVGLTANDVIPMWDAEATGSEEPTKKITASNFVAGMIALGNLLTTGDIVNNLTSASTTSPLSANQGKVISDALMVDTKWSDWTQISTYTSGESWNSSYYCKVGKVVFLRVSVKGLTANSRAEIFTLPSGYRPLMTIDFDGFGGTAYLNHAHFTVSDNGKVYVTSADTYAAGFIGYPAL